MNWLREDVNLSRWFVLLTAGVLTLELVLNAWRLFT